MATIFEHDYTEMAVAKSSGFGFCGFLQKKDGSGLCTKNELKLEDVYTYHHQMAVLCPVDGGLLPTFEVHKALPTRVDVKSSTARDRNN